MALVRSFAKVFGLMFFGLVWFAPAAAAQTGWTLCNETSFVLEAATARQDRRDTIVEGWTRLRPGECRVAVPAPLKPGPHFIYARSSKAHRGGVRSWTGDTAFCVDATGSFQIESPPNCISMGLESRKFQPVMIESRTRWRNKFTETENYSLKTAQAAGLQRLLSDAGVEATAVDGYIGRRTRRAISTFLTDNNLPDDTSDTDLIDVLEQVAIDRSRNVGLTLCNRTEKRIWAAIGRQRGEGWESRGWWQLEAGGCERVIDEPLIATNHYVYAELETDIGIQKLTGASEPFCIARAKFAILGREQCEASKFIDAQFLSTGEPEDQRIVHEFFARNFTDPLAPESGG